MLKSADDNIVKSSEQESRNDFTAALMFCNQAISKFSSIMYSGWCFVDTLVTVLKQSRLVLQIL